MIGVPLGSEYACAHVLENSDQCEENTKKRPTWECKNAKTLRYKKQKATKFEESYICIDCLEVSLKGNRDRKYTSLCRKDNSSEKKT